MVRRGARPEPGHQRVGQEGPVPGPQPPGQRPQPRSGEAGSERAPNPPSPPEFQTCLICIIFQFRGGPVLSRLHALRWKLAQRNHTPKPSFSLGNPQTLGRESASCGMAFFVFFFPFLPTLREREREGEGTRQRPGPWPPPPAPPANPAWPQPPSPPQIMVLYNNNY